MSVLNEYALARLTKRHTVEVDPAAGSAIKRLVHELAVDTSAPSFAAALLAVMRDPDGTFGLVDVKRAPSRVGRDFAIGERFHGCVRLQRIASGWGGVAGAALGIFARSRIGGWVEDSVMSDYAEIVELELTPSAGRPFRMVYRYLSGSPIAGSSTFTIEPLGPSACRFRAVFEFQEVGGLAIEALHRFGIQMHDQVTHVQVERAASRAGARITASTIRGEYAHA